MAGDWIKMRVDLHDDPSVVAMCDALEMDEFSIVGRLHRLWSWADKHTADGITTGISFKWVDRYVNQQGFAEAMQNVGWLSLVDGVLEFPAFETHNGKSAKARCDAAIRQRQSRKRHEPVTEKRDKRVTVPRPFVRAVFNRDEYTCVYCGEQSSPEREATKKSLLSIDHIVPVSRGSGRQAIEDLATCCKRCNNEKNDRTPEEWGLLPEFLQEGVVYTGHTLVTKNCDTDVTKAQPEKIREEKRRVNKKQTSDCAYSPFLEDAHFADLFEKFKASSRANHNWVIAESTAEAWLMQLHDLGLEDAKAALVFSTAAGAKKPITNGDHKASEERKPRGYAGETAKERFERMLPK